MTDCCDWEYCPVCKKEVYASLGTCGECGTYIPEFDANLKKDFNKRSN